MMKTIIRTGQLLRLLLIAVMLLNSRTTAAETVSAVVEQPSAPSPTAAVFYGSGDHTGEEYAGSVFEPAAWEVDVLTLCDSVDVRGAPSLEASVIYTLPRGSFVIPRELSADKQWYMIQPAHWVPKDAVRDRCY